MASYIDIDKKFNNITQIGSGNYENIYKVFDATRNEYFAMKITFIDDNFIIDPTTLREMSNLKKIKDNNIVELVDVSFGLFYKKKCVYLLLELCGTTLFHNFENQNYNINIFNKIKDVVSILHHNGFYHGDISFLNIMINNNKEVKLIDFGTARRIYRKYDTDYKPSLMIQPIEFFNNNFNNVNGTKIDVWSLGCIYYKFKTCDYLIDPVNPRYKKTFMNKFKRICKNAKLQNDDKYLLNNLLHIDPNQRNLRSNNNTMHNFNINNYNIKIKQKNIFNQMSQFDKFNIILFFNEFIKTNNMEDEVLFLTIVNSKKIMGKSNGDPKDNLTWFIILFWLSNEIISINTLSKEDIYTYLSKVESDISNLGVIYRNICQRLGWDIDGNTMYNYIEYIPDDLKEFYKGLILYLEISNYHSDNLIYMLGGILNIFKDKYNVCFEKLEEFISNTGIKYNFEHESYKIKIHVKNVVNKNDEVQQFLKYYFLMTNDLDTYNGICDIGS